MGKLFRYETNGSIVPDANSILIFRILLWLNCDPKKYNNKLLLNSYK